MSAAQSGGAWAACPLYHYYLELELELEMEMEMVSVPLVFAAIRQRCVTYRYCCLQGRRLFAGQEHFTVRLSSVIARTA